jgi:hypothetical protein
VMVGYIVSGRDDFRIYLIMVKSARVIANEVKQSPGNKELAKCGDCFTSFAMTLSDRLFSRL